MRAAAAGAWLAAACLAAPGPAAAQTEMGARGFFGVSGLRFAAAESTRAVLGSPGGWLVGGGGEVVLPGRVFVTVEASRFEKNGTRVAVIDRRVFDLGIDTTVRIRPVELTAGYRFAGLSARVVPYAGGGLGWYRYRETSAFAEAGEDVDETYRGHHVRGGAEVRFGRWIGVAGEVQWATVPDALGRHPSSAAAAFDETDLGGLGVRIKVVVGR